MFKLSKEAKVGLTVLVGFFVLVFGLNFLKGKGVFSGGQTYYGIYNRVGGLTEASPIYYKGYKVGIVQSVKFTEDKQNLIVRLNLTTDVEFSKNTIAEIYSMDLMGSKGIQLIYGDSDIMLEPGDTLNTSLVGDFADKVSQEMIPLKNKAESLVVRVDSLLANVNTLFDEQNKASISSGIQSFGVAMKNVEGISKTMNSSLSPQGSLGRSMASIDSLTTILKQNGEMLSLIMSNLGDVSGQLKDAQIDSVAQEMNKVLVGFNTMITDINDGKGSVGKLLKDEELYYNLNEVSISLDRLLTDVRHNPSRYVKLSAVSFGGGSTAPVSNDVVYKVQLKKSKVPLDIRGDQVKEIYTIAEDQYGKYFIYTVGEDRDHAKIQEVYQSIISEYPDAEIIALQGGKPVKVSKTLK